MRLLTNSFWRSPKLRHWSSTGESAISVITGNFHSRFVLRDLCVDITEQLHTAKVPVLLALRVPQEKDTSANVSSNDPLKYLIRQAIRVHHELQTEKSMALGCATFHEATSESEWFQVLEGILADINSPVYILIDLDILDRSFSPIGGFSWVQAFKQSFNALEARGLATKVKVLFISYGSLPFRLSAMEHSQFVVSAKTQLITARQRTVGRGVNLPQLPFRLKNLPGSSTARGSPRKCPRRLTTIYFWTPCRRTRLPKLKQWSYRCMLSGVSRGLVMNKPCD